MEKDQFVYLCGSLIFGGVIYGIIQLFVQKIVKKDTHRLQTNEDTKKNKSENSHNESSEIYDKIGNNVNKRQAKLKHKKKDIQKFSHSWLAGSLKGHTDTVLDMDFSSNGKFLATCAEDRTVLIWCTKDLLSKDRKSLRVNIEYDHASLVRWSPDGKAFIIYRTIANQIEVYKLIKKSDGSFASATKATDFSKYHEEDVVGMDIACNGRYIITCSKLNDLIIWDLKGQILNSIDTYLGSTHRARISPCGRYIAASGFTPDVKVWEVIFTKSGEYKQVNKCFNLAGHSSGIYDFSFNADTSRMATTSKDGTFRFYNTKVEYEKGEEPHLITSGQWNGDKPACIALSPNAEILVIAHNTSISFYHTFNGKLDTTIENIFNGSITCVKFDSLGQYVLVAGDKHIKIFQNIPGTRASIETACRMLEQKQTSATKDRLIKAINDHKKFLDSMGEQYPQ